MSGRRKRVRKETMEQELRDGDITCPTCGSRPFQFKQENLPRTEQDQLRIYSTLCDTCLKISKSCIGCGSKRKKLFITFGGGNPRISYCRACWGS